MLCVSDCMLVPLSQCVHTGMQALIPVIFTCIDACVDTRSWYFPVSELHVLPISYHRLWVPTKTIPPVSRPPCQYIKVISWKQSAHGSGWRLFMLREGCSLVVNSPGSMERLQSGLNMGQLETCGQELNTVCSRAACQNKDMMYFHRGIGVYYVLL